MFTGLVEEVGTIEQITSNLDGLRISVNAEKVMEGLKVDDSVSCSGICLTVIDMNISSFTVQLVEETLNRTTAKNWKNDSAINLERALLPSSRMGGHFVQGHIDCTSKITDIKMTDESAIFSFTLPGTYQKYIVEKGSICLDGISLTVASINNKEFSIAVIPHTIEATNWKNSKVGDLANLEVDIISKYVENLMDKK
ncbi:MAG: riboflavin synthase [Candidatus Neomarinimicrobiota bacterium]|nr:MAG: riboflavin synthase [bacterium]|tara:strand:- start:122 stop:712 length:591 start_codon:yes stop_codon:yes gene_type:complete